MPEQIHSFQHFQGNSEPKMTFWFPFTKMHYNPGQINPHQKQLSSPYKRNLNNTLPIWEHFIYNSRNLVLLINFSFMKSSYQRTILKLVCCKRFKKGEFCGMWIISQLKIPLEEHSAKNMISAPQDCQGNQKKKKKGKSKKLSQPRWA